ncbi:MAG: beta-galactosidase [Tannerella sp.]|jgi:beta-galactosidase|nr:beta-galactosidase [Tannerella sp.]
MKRKLIESMKNAKLEKQMRIMMLSGLFLIAGTVMMNARGGDSQKTLEPQQDSKRGIGQDEGESKGWVEKLSEADRSSIDKSWKSMGGCEDNPVAYEFAQPKFDNILYGAAYYHEYMPSERLDKDIRLMKDCGLSVVRVGESSWGQFEPKEGQFEFEWMDRIINEMHKAGIKVILGTPTYSIPAWMAEKYPEILAQYQRGSKAYYGIRQNMDITNPAYLFYSERIIRKLMERYASHPGVIGYQVDNETVIREINNHGFFTGFRNYIKNKFDNNLDSLNRAWGLNYWGMNIHTWEEFYARDGVTNPSYKVEWERYGRKKVADFLNWQVDIVNEYKRNDQFVTHCFMPALHELDQVESMRRMQYPAVNIYHDVQDSQDGHLITYGGDYFRTVYNGNYLITETNAQGIGWDAKTQYPPYDNQLRQNVYSHLSSGANMVEYWHWSSLHYGQETYWKGLLGHDLEPNRVYKEFSMVAKELKNIGNKLVNLKKKNKVALFFSHDSYYGLQFMRYTNEINYPAGLLHRALYNMNIETDIIPCDNETFDFSQYEMLVIPPLYIASDLLLEKIDLFVKNGGKVIMMYKSGYCNEHSAVRAVKSPGPLRKACGFYYQEYSTIDSLKLKETPWGEIAKPVGELMEFIIPETAKPLAYVDHPFFGQWPVITENSYGKGSLIYIGTYPSLELMEKIVRKEAENMGIVSPEQYKFPVIVKEGINDRGQNIRYIFNYSGKEQEIKYNYAKNGIDILSNKPVKSDEVITLSPWDLIIVEEKNK